MKLTELIEKRIHENVASYDLGTLESYKYLIEMIAIEYHNEQLRLYNVSQQRELLIAYRTMIEFDIKHKDFEESVDYFLKNKESYL